MIVASTQFVSTDLDKAVEQFSLLNQLFTKNQHPNIRTNIRIDHQIGCEGVTVSVSVNRFFDNRSVKPMDDYLDEIKQVLNLVPWKCQWGFCFDNGYMWIKGDKSFSGTDQ